MGIAVLVAFLGTRGEGRFNMGCGRALCTVLVLLLAIVVPVFYNAYTRFDLWREVPDELFTSNDDCVVMRGPMGMEDLNPWRDVVLATNMDITPLMELRNPSDPSHANPRSAQPGHIFVLEGASTVSKDAMKKESTGEKAGLSLLPAKRVSYPSDIAFHPHGIGVINDMLFVVNHAYLDGGERVDVFELVDRRGENDDEQWSGIELHYKYSVDFTECCNGIMNDVVPTSESTFYVTRYLPEPDPLQGRSLTTTNMIGMTLFMLGVHPSYGSGGTTFYACETNAVDARSTDVCVEQPYSGAMWNGITVSPDHSTVYVVELFRRVIGVFARTDSPSELEHNFDIPSVYTSDNILFDRNDGQLWYGGVADCGKCLNGWLPAFKEEYARLREQDPSATPSGGPVGDLRCPGHASHTNPLNGQSHTAVLHDGSLLGGVSAGIRVGDVVVLGSFCDNGLLICSV